MGIFALLLVSAMLPLCNLAPCDLDKHLTNLRDIISEIGKYNDTTNRFVEDVQDLAEAGCEDTFFCTVLGILKNNYNINDKTNEQEEKILRNLAMFVQGSKMNCEKIQKTKENAVITPITVLLGFLQDCSKRRISLS